jgi:hypothetical protein
MSATIDTWTGGLGLLAGFCVVAAWLAIAGRPADAPSPSASIRLGTLATGELAIAPIGKPVLDGSALRPGDRGETGTVSIRNETPRALDVSLRTTAIQKELDRAGWIEVTDGGRAIVRTPLEDADAWSTSTVRLSPREGRRLRARIWIPSDAPDGWQAARGDLTLEFRGKAVER